MTIFDFWRTRTQVSIAKLDIDSARSDLMNNEEQVIFNVKQAYYTLLNAKRNLEVAVETVNQFQQHLDQAKAFYEVGTKPKFDVTNAEVDLGNSQLNLIRAENSLKVARVTLNNTLGMPDAPEYEIEDNLSFVKYNIGLQEAINRAYENRPELKSIAFQKKAAEESVWVAKTGYFPVLTGNAAYSWAGHQFPQRRRLEHRTDSFGPCIQWFFDEIPGVGGQGQPVYCDCQRRDAPAECTP